MNYLKIIIKIAETSYLTNRLTVVLMLNLFVKAFALSFEFLHTSTQDTFNIVDILKLSEMLNSIFSAQSKIFNDMT